VTLSKEDIVVKLGAQETLKRHLAVFSGEYEQDDPEGPGPGAGRGEFGRDAPKKIPFPGVRHTEPKRARRDDDDDEDDASKRTERGRLH
jgi:hypothetical protein